jgi:hypothetical protein
MLKILKHTPLDNSYEAEVRKLLAVDLLILDDFALDTLDPTQSPDRAPSRRLYHRLLESRVGRNGSLPSPILFARRARSIASRATPTTW